MAEATTFRNNATPYPIYAQPWVIVFPLLDADGDPISPSSPDSEVSKNGDTFADCTNEATEIATSSGVCYLALTATEMTADIVAVRIQSTGAKTTIVTLYPRKLVSIRAGTSASAGSSTSTIVLDASASAVDDFYNGMVCVAVIDSNTEVRMISDYTGSNQTATVVPDWNVAPDNNDTFTIYRPDGVQVQQANTTHINSTAQTARDIGASVLLSSGTGTGQLDFTSGVVKANATQFAGQAITCSGGVTIPAATLASTTNITAAAGCAVSSIGNDVVTAAAIAADAIIEIQSGLSTLDAAGVRTAVGLASANLDTQLAAIDDLIDTEVAAIKAKTDSLTFTVAGKLDCNILYVNSLAIDGAGTSVDPWGPA